VEAAQAIAAGRLDTRITELRRDELGELCAAFNSMAERMQASHDSLLKQSEELEDRVAERTDALEKANRQLQEAAARDSLTGLYNRRHFNDVLGQLFAESTRYRTDLTCMMIDLDNFKHVNDSLGHQTGDRLLQLVAEIIRRSVRESDVAVRYGGDEFAVILPRTAPDEARTSAERLLDSFRREVVAQLPEASIASLSIGVASRHQDHPSSSADLINLADEALYLAKAGGKNRITVLRPSETSSIRG
jgi:diguanylate cyclase (GGDEF)-like protein